MKSKVLIASADKYSNLLLSDKLSKSFDVHTVSDGKSASDFLVRSGNVDLLICDYMMPVLGGIDLTKRIKGSYSAGSMKILMMTTALNLPLFEQMINSGVDAVVEKSLDLSDIESRVWRILPGISQS